MRNERHDEPLSDTEVDLFVQYLHRFARHDLDLFTLMEVGDPAYPAYVTITRDPDPEFGRTSYHRP